MAVGLKVLATPTKTLSAYSDFITVADAANLPGRIEEAVHAPRKPRQPEAYAEVLEKADWGAQMAPVLSRIGEIISNKRPSSVSVKTVDIVNINFYDWDGEVLYKGGAERYVFDLACLLKEQGWTPRILQNANREFTKEYRGIPIVGVETRCGHDLRGMSKKYREVCQNADLVIASPLDLACELWGLNVIGINHGIYWDHKFKTLSNVNVNEYRNIFDALKVVATSVCVDTNFINWVRTYDYSLGKKLKYVPNYFEGNEFTSSEKDFAGKIRVLYPRRLYEARGIFITLKAFEYLFKRYDDIELHLVGQANEEDTKVISEFVERYSGRVVWEELDMHEMFKAYQTSHIALVPTMYSEGTSLSCLEAMATNNAVIATNIGGLPNLVIDQFNGLLIDPNSEALVKAIESILMDREKMRLMASKGLDVAKVFEKQNWRKRWMDTVTEVKV
jgi:glycosyltransferase involved in cell wall biosynthesis